MALQLTYDLRTTPDPLEVGGSNSKLTVIGSVARSGLVNITSITISIPIGTGSQALADSSTTIAAAGPDGWEISGNAAQGTFTFTPPDAGDNGISSGLIFEFSDISVNSSEGTALVSIAENSPTNYQEFPVSKFPATFELGPLTVTPTEPISAGDTATLHWDGSEGYTYAIEPADLLASPIDPTTNKGSAQTKPLSNTTIFTLSVSNGDNQHSAVTQRMAGVVVDGPEIAGFKINDSTEVSDVNLGETLKLSWETKNADHVLVLANAQPIGFFPADDAEATLPAKVGGRYRAVAYYGDISAGVHSPPSEPVLLALNPPTATLTVTPAVIYADYQSVTLDWSTQNATSAKLQTGAQGPEFGVDLSDSGYAVYPQATTQYKITAIYDANEALGTMASFAQMVPATMLTATDTTDDSSSEGTDTATATMKPCPLQIFIDDFHPGGSNTHTLTSPATVAVSYVAGFNNTYNDDDKHELREWHLQGTASLDEAGTTLTTGCTMALTDENGKTMNANATLTTITVCWNADDTGAFLNDISLNHSGTSFTFPGTGYESLMAGISNMSFWCRESDEDSEVNGFQIYVTQPPPDSFKENPEADTTEITIMYGGYCHGKKTFDYGLSFGPLATIGIPASSAGSGFGLAVVSNGNNTVSFPQPVEKAYTFLCKWEDNGDGDNHTVELLKSDYVRATTQPNSQTVSLDWGEALWSDGYFSHDPWPATRQIIVLACYGETSLPRSSG